MSEPPATGNVFANDGSFLEKFRQLQKQKQAQQASEPLNSAPATTMTADTATATTMAELTSSEVKDEGTKKRKNRWDDAPPQLPISSSPPASPAAPAASIPQQRSVPKKPVVVSDVYQPGMIKVGGKWMYPEDENVEGGTYEHKKRKKEMEETEKKAMELTTQATRKGAHHLSDYLPKEELEKFMKKVQTVKSGQIGTDEEEDEYKTFKLDESNKGFKLLKQAGWTEGKGLGSQGTGMVSPLTGGSTSRPGNLGLGKEETHEVTEEDDDFETYRKRMMLAYKFRPNPLNNPRRSYY